ncbi:cilia- and flagella-associated protein 206-like isoform X5 [Nymphalis io]|uniref:cilia- and flagella-associated protein 206-like isoform X1 n=1 Tax=Inachis io TaxID=171585 RepID=UPI00216764E4|nr:cilia- and flagella-associated protein 206-like isoform X1 [Nymphalis io]XP_050357483.1 cilia- and flagella-associated protein 206-like isoform X2 [Nymphalis io]XP_050357484.1 cilia- and flagella-associated protein 206-like isoform X3 [Nymphalis io]XP_050357486.1 cilia- and flagella-associated protein 206-like isoform X4 [Nymphalis io]XP_050357487.1 cilia- and flagella-associated protein 206-like isoform X5 [Nymphalis io]
MACDENVIKNMANEITRNCQSQNVIVDTDFVIYLIDLLLLNPKYGRMFSKTISRNNLETFVNDCVNMLTSSETSINTLKMQFIMRMNYDKLQNLIDKHLDSIDQCLRPLINEILEEDPVTEDDTAVKKLFRKISIYIILSSGLGNPGSIVTLKEGVAALESVFSLEDLKIFIALPRSEKMAQLIDLVQITSGVRLFNRDCKKGGEGIPDLPFNLVDAGKACLASLSNSLITVMQRVNSLTSAIADTITIQDETGNVIIDIPTNSELTENNYKQIFELLAFNRQYELYIRKLLSDVETMVQNGTHYVDKVKHVLEELHATVKYKAAVPVVTVFPLFTKLWRVWRSMQNIMYLMSTVNRLMSILGNISDQMKIPYHIIDKMLEGKNVVTDQDRMSDRVSITDRITLGSLKNYVAYGGSFTVVNDRNIQFLGFCALCLSVGALVPSNMKVGLIQSKGYRYGFCSVKMATRFSKDSQRYVNEVLEFARNNPHVINLLNILEEVKDVKTIDNLVTRVLPKTKISDKDIQTDTHPIDGHMEKNYSWDMWEWKRRACQWATIVNCRTHSTQTDYSHLRSEIHCQTVEPRDKCLQTKKDSGVNTNPHDEFLWGLRGKIGYGQHAMKLNEETNTEKEKARVVEICSWPCVTTEE